jgi:hypothetical protein
MAVITIIGILLSLVLLASVDADKQARIQATQALIQKLDTALSDRLNALLESTPNPNWAHGYLAASYSQNAVSPTNSLGMLPPSGVLIDVANNIYNDNPAVKATLRAQVFATFDYIKSELPDTFFVNPAFPSQSPYPFSFAAVPFMGTPVPQNPFGNYVLPLGHMIQGPLIAPTLVGSTSGFGDSFVDPNTGILNSSNPTLGFTGSGIFGASYTAAAGLYKNLGYLAQGYDTVDNNGNGLIDEYAEGIGPDPTVPVPGDPKANPIPVSQLVQNQLANHTHVTARAEMLYAILVGGTGPFGAAFNPDDFSDKEVQDTDGDGLPEFIDGWGHPLQFFRWPVLYQSDYQRGQNKLAASAGTWNAAFPYQTLGALDQREQDPLDVNQQLLAPGWWAFNGVGGLASNNLFPPQFVPAAPPLPGGSGASAAVSTFGALFHRITEPMPVTPPNLFVWDRSGSPRRAFYSKFLILSSGPDGLPGVFLYSDATLKQLATTVAAYPGLGASLGLIANENNAMQFGLDFIDTSGLGFMSSGTIQTGVIVPPPPSHAPDPNNPISYEIQMAGQDDITNHNVGSAGGLGGPGS